MVEILDGVILCLSELLIRRFLCDFVFKRTVDSEISLHVIISWDA